MTERYQPTKRKFDAFVKHCHWFAQTNYYLGTPDGAINRCGQVSRRFVDWMKPHGVNRRGFKVSLLELRGFGGTTRGWHRWHKRHTKRPKDAVHVVVRFGDWTVDFTRRQFQPKATFPFFAHMSYVTTEWAVVKRLRV